MTEVVGIDLARGTLLARTCLAAQIELAGELNRITRSLQAVGEDPTVVIAGYEVAQWLGTSGAAILATIAAVGGWGPPDAALASSVLWGRRLDAASSDPGQAFAAANQAVSARDRGDDETFEGLLATWASDPVFAVTLAEHLDVEYVVDWLEAVQLSRGQDDAGEGRRSSSEVLGSLSIVVAVAAGAGAPPFSLEQLLDAADDRSLGLGDAAVFMRASAPWPREWLRDAMTLIVVPLNEGVVRGGRAMVDRQFGDEVFDVRVPILESVAADEKLAREVMATFDMKALVGNETNYGDQAAAMAAVVIAGTRPSPSLDAEQIRLAASGARRFIEFLEPGSDLQPALLDALGVIAIPYLGAFRVDSADRRVNAVTNPLPEISEVDLREYLDVAASSLQTVTTLRTGVTVWTAARLASSGAAPPGPDLLHDLGSVRRFIDESTLGYERTSAQRRDEARADLQQILQVVAMIPGLIPQTKVVGDVVSVGLDAAVPFVFPDLNDEIDHLAAVPQLTGRAQEALEWQLLAHLWRHREASGVFDVLESPPTSIVEVNGLLTNPSTFTDAQWDDFKLWRDSVADATGVDNLGAAYGRDVPPTTDLSD